MSEIKYTFTPTKKLRYNAVNEYFKAIFGAKIYKLSLDANVTCPNRDGSLGTRGCIFCSEGGSGDFAERCDLDLHGAIERAKNRVKNKTKDNKFIAYFQSYTNTYAPIEKLERLFYGAINRDDVVALSIATRPDCLDLPVLNLIKNLCQIKPVFVELGLQTADENTAKFIRRGYEYPVFVKAVENLKAVGAKVVVHLIIGLPGESEQTLLNSVKQISKLNIDGVKLQLLHVMQNTDLASLYEKEPFEILTQEKYYYLLAKCINTLPKEIVIHRLTGDAPKKLLIQPKWSANKKAVLNGLAKYFEQNGVLQGKDLV